MIQWQILSGKMAGSSMVARRFPFLIGRSSEAGLRLEDAGVWEDHVRIEFVRGRGFTFAAGPGATVVVNHETAVSGLLRSGDLVELGSAQLRFWLAATRQKSLCLAEAFTWCSLGILFAAQLWILLGLLR